MSQRHPQKQQMQTKKQSLIETSANIFIGWIISVASSAIIFPLLGVDLPLEANLKASVFFTIVSIARTYFVRRYFNSKLKRNIENACTQ